MAWLSGLADKAENLLNKIDKNTAAVLNKDTNKYELPRTRPSEISPEWLSPESGLNENTSKISISEPSEHIPYVCPNTNLTPAELLNATALKEDALFTYLNTPGPSPNKTIESTTSSLLVEDPNDDTDSELSIQSERISSSPTHVSLNILDDKDVEVNAENTTLHVANEVQNLGCEFVNQQIVEAYTQNEHNIGEHSAVHNSLSTYIELNTNDLKPNHFNNLNDLSRKDLVENKYVQKYLKDMETNMEKQCELFGKQKTDHQKEIVVLNEKLKSLETEKAQQLKQITGLQFIVDRNRQELNSIRSELEQHKARALKTLQEKEKLIAELKSNALTTTDEATIMELNQLKQERDNVREENQQICQQLKILREELINANLNSEKIKKISAETNLQNQEILANERRRRLEAEEDARLHSEEIRSLKDELISQRNRFSLQLQKQDTEISKLRLQLSTSVTPSNEMDSRLTSLTQTLVLKQQALECLTTERNALRLQLEKIEHEYKSAAGNLRKNISYNNINDTDDAKAQVPTFLMETPFDTSVTRRVKRAYSSLDAISIRTGVFLRRYPLARIVVLIYMGLLQFWVLVVLLSQSPEAH